MWKEILKARGFWRGEKQFRIAESIYKSIHEKRVIQPVDRQNPEFFSRTENEIAPDQVRFRICFRSTVYKITFSFEFKRDRR